MPSQTGLPATKDDSPGRAAAGPASLFRREAADAWQRRWLGKVGVAHVPGAAVSALAGLLAIAGLASATVLIQVSDTLEAAAIVMPDGGFERLVAPRSGTIRGLDVAVGNRVREGRLLLAIVGEQAPEGTTASADARLASLRRESVLLATRLERDLDQAGRHADMLEARRSMLLEEIRALDDEVSSRRELVSLYRVRAARSAGLADRGVISRQQSEERRAAQREVEAAHAAARSRRAAKRAELEALDNQLRVASGAAQGLRLENELASERVRRQIAAEKAAQAVPVTATSDALIGGVHVSNGEFVASGQLLITLLGAERPSRLRIYVGAAEMLALRVGQPVVVRLPRSTGDLMLLEARIESVAGVAVPARDIDGLDGIPGPVFSVDARIETPVSAGTGLRPGALLAASIATRRRPLYRWMLRVATGDGAG